MPREIWRRPTKLVLRECDGVRNVPTVDQDEQEGSKDIPPR